MKNSARACAVSLVVVAVGVVGLRAADSAVEQPPPPRPPWVNADGTLDVTKAPTDVPILGPDGKQMKGPDGRGMTYDLRADLEKEEHLQVPTLEEIAEQDRRNGTVRMKDAEGNEVAVVQPIDPRELARR